MNLMKKMCAALAVLWLLQACTPSPAPQTQQPVTQSPEIVVTTAAPATEPAAETATTEAAATAPEQGTSTAAPEPATATLPPATLPPATLPPVTLPPATLPPSSAGLCSQFGPAADISGANSDWNVCRTEAYGFEVQVPLDAALLDATETTARISLPYTPGTNLSEKFLDISAAEQAETCTSPRTAGYPPGTIQPEPVQLNGIDFIRERGQDAAAGSAYRWTAYSTSQGGLCVSLDFVLRSFDPGVVETPPPLYDEQAESAVFEAVAATFSWLETGGGQAPTQGADGQDAERISFASGGVSAEVTGRLEAAGSKLYVLEASQGQPMRIDLSFSEGAAILAVWGEDGTVLMSDHAESPAFEGLLPATQDYFIQVKGRPDGATGYRMTVTIPPA